MAESTLALPLCIPQLLHPLPVPDLNSTLCPCLPALVPAVEAAVPDSVPPDNPALLFGVWLRCVALEGCICGLPTLARVPAYAPGEGLLAIAQPTALTWGLDARPCLPRCCWC